MVQVCRRCGQMHDAYTGCTLAVHVARRPTVVGADEALVGNVIEDRYRVGEVMGQGSTGTVFGVQHVSFARHGAMKVLRPRHGDDASISRVFHGEARASWSVSHPCLTEVFDIGTLPDGAPFFVMERLDGETLATRIARERLSIASSVDMMMQLLSAVASVHARDLLVRDMRPQNLFLAHRRGCRPLLKILDLGLSRLTALEHLQIDWDAGPATGQGGTTIPYYLSPERARSENAVEVASDIFVAAVVFYEALAGQRPFTATSFEGLLVQICSGKAIPLNDHRSDVSPELGAFIGRSLSPNPRHRPASAKEMQDELRSIFEGNHRKHPTGHGHPAPAERKEPTSTFSIPISSAALSVASPVAIAEALPDESMFASMAPTPHVPAQIPDHLTQQANTDVPPVIPNYDEIDAEEETETKRGPQRGDLHVPVLPSAIEEEDLSTAARKIDPRALVDEASADNADRTVPPPPPPPQDVSVEVDVSALGLTPSQEEDRTVNRRAIAKAIALEGEDEETETMQLTPELKARVDAMLNTKKPSLPQPVPPPRVKPPPRR